MASVSELARLAQKFTIDNSPLILTGIGAAGVVTTAVLGVKAGFKARDLIDAAEFHQNLHGDRIMGSRTKLSNKERAKLTWMCYIPPATSAVLTCGAIVGASAIGTKRMAALAAAYSLSEKAFDEYRDAVVEKLGPKKEGDIRDDTAQNRMNKSPLGDREIIIMGDEFICQDGLSGRYFKNSHEGIKFAINKINHQINTQNYASLADFYNEIGLSATQESHEVGWNIDKLLDVHITTCLTDKGEPALALEYRVVPIRGFSRVH